MQVRTWTDIFAGATTFLAILVKNKRLTVRNKDSSYQAVKPF